MKDKNNSNEVNDISTALLADLILIQLGWRTESEQKRYVEAMDRILKEARKMHLRAELESLG